MNNSTDKIKGKLPTIPDGYGRLLEDLKTRIRQAQTRAIKF